MHNRRRIGERAGHRIVHCGNYTHLVNAFGNLIDHPGYVLRDAESVKIHRSIALTMVGIARTLRFTPDPEAKRGDTAESAGATEYNLFRVVSCSCSWSGSQQSDCRGQQ